MCLPGLNFKYDRFAFWWEGHVSLSIIPIFMSFVAISSTSYVAVSEANIVAGNEVVSLVGILPNHGLIIVKINHAISR